LELPKDFDYEKELSYSMNPAGHANMVYSIKDL
jgi:hypothetical protein